MCNMRSNDCVWAGFGEYFIFELINKYINIIESSGASSTASSRQSC